jgi:hypothetical protein
MNSVAMSVGAASVAVFALLANCSGTDAGVASDDAGTDATSSSSGGSDGGSGSETSPVSDSGPEDADGSATDGGSDASDASDGDAASQGDADECDAGLTKCGGQCVDTQTDSNNCHQCGDVCGTVREPGCPPWATVPWR